MPEHAKYDRRHHEAKPSPCDGALPLRICANLNCRAAFDFSRKERLVSFRWGASPGTVYGAMDCRSSRVPDEASKPSSASRMVQLDHEVNQFASSQDAAVG